MLLLIFSRLFWRGLKNLVDSVRRTPYDPADNHDPRDAGVARVLIPCCVACGPNNLGGSAQRIPTHRGVDLAPKYHEHARAPNENHRPY